MKHFALFALCAYPWISLASEQSPYSGEEQRSIKSLSAEEIRSLNRGDGMGFAKLAELNHFPGPKHVLSISEELGLSPSQQTDTKALFEEMRRRAVAIGNELLLAESQLDKKFESGIIDTEGLERDLLDIGKLRASLRFVHLEAHLRQKKLLKPDQIRKYDAIRGYHGVLHHDRDHSEISD
jgi:hypothetical protein